jgi:hypothetical protein
METERCLWPSPPPHYKHAKLLSPPPIPNDPEMVVYDTPILETYKEQIERLEKEQALFFDTSNFGMYSLIIFIALLYTSFFILHSSFIILIFLSP